MEMAPIDINHYLPHRKPMLMVDLILKMDDQIVETVFEIKPDNIFVQNGLFAEAGLIENAAQTCSAVVAKGYYVNENGQDEQNVDLIGFISALKTMKIFALPKLGDTISTNCTLVSQFTTDDYTLCTMHCTTRVGQTLLLEGEINLFIQEKPTANASVSQ